jgi:hypothetical protein
MSWFRSKRVLAALVILPFALVLASVIAFRVLCTFETRTSTYGSLTIFGDRGQYDALNSLEPTSCELIVEIPGEGRFPIAAIPPDVLNRRFRQYESGEMLSYSTHGEGWFLELRYDRGKFQSFHGRPFSFQRTLSEKPLSFPIDYDMLHAEWGSPDSIVSRRVMERVAP